MYFTVEETNLMCIYGTDTRERLIAELEKMRGDLQADETELLELSNSVVEKLKAMTNEEFNSVKDELVGDFG